MENNNLLDHYKNMVKSYFNIIKEYEELISKDCKENNKLFIENMK